MLKTSSLHSFVGRFYFTEFYYNIFIFCGNEVEEILTKEYSGIMVDAKWLILLHGIEANTTIFSGIIWMSSGTIIKRCATMDMLRLTFK